MRIYHPFRVDHDLENRSKHFVELFKCLIIDQMSETDLSDLKNYHLVLDSDEATAILDSEISNRKSEGTNSNKRMIRTKIRGPAFLPCVVGQVEDKHWIFRFDYRSENSLVFCCASLSLACSGWAPSTN